MEEVKVRTPKLISPQELHNAAIERMLQGREPQSPQDWFNVLRFYTASCDPRFLPSAVVLVAALFGCPFNKDQIETIVAIARLEIEMCDWVDAHR